MTTSMHTHPIDKGMALYLCAGRALPSAGSGPTVLIPATDGGDGLEVRHSKQGLRLHSQTPTETLAGLFGRPALVDYWREAAMADTMTPLQRRCWGLAGAIDARLEASPLHWVRVAFSQGQLRQWHHLAGMSDAGGWELQVGKWELLIDRPKWWAWRG